MIYFLKVNVAIALFYVFYRLFLHNDTFFGWRRAALVSFFLLAAGVPLLNIQTWVAEQKPMAAVADYYAVMLPEPEVVADIPDATYDWSQLLTSGIGLLYGGVAAWFIVRLLLQLASIVRLHRRCPRRQIEGTEVHLLAQGEAPFSFFRWIFVHPDAYTAEELDEILIHEQTHARQWHSVDILLGELACIACWFNPFAWLLKREIRTNLEYMADARVLATGHDSRTYQYHLLGLAYQKAAANIYNNFNVLPLKKRIKMMNKKRTKKIGRTKYLMFLPLAALLLVVSNIESVARTTKRIAKDAIASVDSPDQEKKTVTYKGKVVDKNGKPLQGVEIQSDMKFMRNVITTSADGSFNFQIAAEAPVLFFYRDGNQKKVTAFTGDRLPKENRENWTVIYDEGWSNVEENKLGTPDNPVYEVVDQAPEFPGGMEALMKAIQASIVYPANAYHAGRQGKVAVQFVIDKEGNVTNPKVVRKVDPELDKEALRVISSLPKWKPGMQKGKAVNVQYSVPITFKLSGDTKVASSDKSGDGEIYDVVAMSPEFPGGVSGLMEYLSKNIKYPAEAQKQKIEGRVVVQIIIDEDGTPIEGKVDTSAHPLLDAEALRLCSSEVMPKWTPGKLKDGTPTKVRFTFPIVFKLQ